MFELLTIGFVVALLVVLFVGSFVVSFFLNKYKKENPELGNWDWINREQTKYWNKK